MKGKGLNARSRLVNRSKGERHMPFRRTVSIDDALHSMIQKTRGQLLSYEIDVDYTRAVNMLLVLGLKKFNEHQWSAEEAALIRAYIWNDRLKWESLIDVAQDEFMKNLPKIAKDLAEKFIEVWRTAPSTPKQQP